MDHAFVIVWLFGFEVWNLFVICFLVAAMPRYAPLECNLDFPRWETKHATLDQVIVQ